MPTRCLGLLPFLLSQRNGFSSLLHFLPSGMCLGALFALACTILYHCFEALGTHPDSHIFSLLLLGILYLVIHKMPIDGDFTVKKQHGMHCLRQNKTLFWRKFNFWSCFICLIPGQTLPTLPHTTTAAPKQTKECDEPPLLFQHPPNWGGHLILQEKEICLLDRSSLHDSMLPDDRLAWPGCLVFSLKAWN